MSNYTQEEIRLLQQAGVVLYDRPAYDPKNLTQWCHKVITVDTKTTCQFWEQSIITFCDVKEEELEGNPLVRHFL